MEKIINSRQNAINQRMAERFDFKEVRPNEIETPKSWEDLPIYITTNTINAILGVSMPFIGKCIASGELKATKKAGKWYVDKEDFKAWMQAS